LKPAYRPVASVTTACRVSFIHGIDRHASPIAMRQCGHAALPIGGEYPANMPPRLSEQCRPFPDREHSPIHCRDHQAPLLFLLVHCHVLHNGHFR